MNDVCVITVDNLITLCKENNISTDTPIIANDEGTGWLFFSAKVNNDKGGKLRKLDNYFKKLF